MEPIDIDLAFSLKTYVDSRERMIAKTDYKSYPLRFLTFEFFEAYWIRELIDKEYDKCIKTREKDHFNLKTMISSVTHMMSASSEEELKMKFISFLVNY